MRVHSSHTADGDCRFPPVDIVRAINRAIEDWEKECQDNTQIDSAAGTHNISETVSDTVVTLTSYREETSADGGSTD